MKELLETFSISEIFLFVVLLAAAFKGVVSWVDWFRGKIKNKYGEDQEKEDRRKKMENDLIQIRETQVEMAKAISSLTENVNLLMDSDKDDIKAWITEKHHYFCYTLGYIDDYNLDCIEKRFSHYEIEGGNSFVGDLMKEIRALPKKTNDTNYLQK